MKPAGVYLTLAALAAALSVPLRSAASELELLAQQGDEQQQTNGTSVTSSIDLYNGLSGNIDGARNAVNSAIKQKNYDSFIEAHALLTLYQILELDQDTTVEPRFKSKIAKTYVSTHGRYVHGASEVASYISRGENPQLPASTPTPQDICAGWNSVIAAAQRIFGSSGQVIQQSPTFAGISASYKC